MFLIFISLFSEISNFETFFIVGAQKTNVPPPSNPGPGGRAQHPKVQKSEPFIQVLSEHDVLELAASEVQCDKLLLGFSSSSSFDLQRLDLGPGVWR